MLTPCSPHPALCLWLGTPRVPAYWLYLNTDQAQQTPELLVIVPYGYEILWQHITLPNAGCSISPCWSTSGSAAGIRALWIQQHCVSPGGGKLFHGDAWCLFSCQQMHGLGFFSIHCQLFPVSYFFAQSSLHFRCHWLLFPMPGLARFKTEQNFRAECYRFISTWEENGEEETNPWSSGSCDWLPSEDKSFWSTLIWYV